MREKIYVAGPYTKGDVAVNVKTAIEAADDLANLGFVPFLPHLTHFWHLHRSRPYAFWCEYDLEFLEHCKGLLRLPGESSGSDTEVAVAKSLGIPIFYTITHVDQHFSEETNGKSKK